MIPIHAILRAVARAMRRDLGSFVGLKVNNFFLFVLLLAYGNAASGLPPCSAYPFLLLIAFLLLFPLSSDPLAKIPPIRFGLWPLMFSERAGLRLVSLGLSPVFWMAAILLWRTSVSLGLAFLGVAAATQAGPAVFRGSREWEGRRRGSFRLRLTFPGKPGPLVAAAMRQMFSVPDTFVALLIALGGCWYRLFYPSADPAAYPIFSLLIALAFSTYAQCLFGLDSESAITRYRLLPLRQWEVLLAKDAAFLGVLLLFTLPLSPTAGITSGVTALATGRFPALQRGKVQYRGRFTGGSIFFGAAQIILGAAFGLAAANTSLVIALVPIVGYWWSFRINHRW